MSCEDIATIMKCNKLTVSRILKLYEEDHLCLRRAGSGRPRKTNDRDNLHILLEVKRNRNINCTQIKKSAAECF